MLPNEVLLNVLHFMDRKGLDALQITSQLLQSLVEKEFAASPLRLFGVSICEGKINLSPSAGGPWVSTSLPQLKSYLRAPCEKVDSLYLLVHFTENHLRQLMPFAEHFIGIHVQAQTTFASEAVFTGLFSQVVRWRSVLFSGTNWIPASFFSLPAMVNCSKVVIEHCFSLSRNFPAETAVEWLHNGPPDVEKQLIMDSGYAMELVDGLKGSLNRH
ncbi:hypothetical protein AAVH_25314 [Aphelenchoides avenae]|nr:hypothetical protein AAVH_25314 [Aphelenchus avenae]